MTTREHFHWGRVRCSRPGCDNSAPETLTSVGVVSGLSGVAEHLMRHLGFDPTDHPAVTLDLELALGEETVEIGRTILASHGLDPDAEEPGR